MREKSKASKERKEGRKEEKHQFIET